VNGNAVLVGGAGADRISAGRGQGVVFGDGAQVSYADGALREAFKLKDRLVFMDFITDQSENVWPMVKAGKGLTEMLLGSEDL
jgi:Ca2+-binding RTX toxin-like protein